MRWLALPLATTVALLAACAPESPTCARLPGGARYCLQTSEGVVPFEVQQKIDVTFNGQHETMIAQVEVDAAGMHFVGLTPLGQRLLRASFSDGEIRADGVALEKLDPALLLALIQLASWEASRVRPGLDGDAELEEIENGRHLVKDGKAVLRIGYTRGHPPTGDIRIELPGTGVEFSIVTLDESDAK